MVTGTGILVPSEEGEEEEEVEEGRRTSLEERSVCSTVLSDC